MQKVKVELQIDSILLKKAELYRIDLETFLEIKLHEYLTGREQFYKPNSLTYHEIKEDFEKWLKSRISLETADRYLDILKDLDEITPQTLINIYQSRPANNVAKAIRNLVNYLIEKEMIDERTADKIKKAVPIKKGKGDKVVPTNEDIREAFEYFKQKLEPEYYLVALVLLYSGARLEQTLRMLQEWDPKYLVFKDGFARYEISHLSQGYKEGFWIYMPDWLAKKLRKMSDLSKYTKDIINYKAKSGRTVSAKYIRKWFNNLLVKLKVDKDIRNFILGRIGEIKISVEADDYLKLLEQADEEYPRILENFPFDFKI
jgi:intergrase/recombinase